MGNRARGRKMRGASILLAAALFMPGVRSSAGLVAAGDLAKVNNEINALERELLQTKQYQGSAESQLKKIKKLLLLQQKEIRLSQAKIKELGAGMEELAAQKRALLAKIDHQKAAVRTRLSELYKLTDREALDASWLQTLDVDNQKAYYLAKTLRRDCAQVEGLKKDVSEALGLELRILEERNKLDYYVQELQAKSVLLNASESAQREILKTNRASRLEAMRRVQELKESEREIERMIVSFRADQADTKVAAPVAPSRNQTGGFVAGRGRLPFPVEGAIMSSFGKSYNPKTNLLTFQKGITLSAAPGAPVRSVFDGKVVFSGPLKNYGKIVILEHPGKYFTLYGQMGRIEREVGAEVRGGEVLGAASTEPLYFEIRDKNVAINPAHWLVSNPANGNGDKTRFMDKIAGVYGAHWRRNP